MLNQIMLFLLKIDLDYNNIHPGYYKHPYSLISIRLPWWNILLLPNIYDIVGKVYQHHGMPLDN